MNIRAINPFRYRSYYYDVETGLYYLNSRYYDPEVGRFINADGIDTITASFTELTDKNLYAYCDNNPTTRKDDGGEFWNIIIGAAVGAVFSAVTTAIDSYVNTGSIDWGKVGISAAVGAVSGGIAATGFGTIAQASVSAIASMVGSVSTDIYERSKDENAGKFTLEEIGQITLRAVSSVVVGFGCSVFGTAAGNIATNGIKAKGADMVFRGKLRLSCFSKAQSREMVKHGKRLINTARGLSSVIGTIFTWPTSTALSYGLD